jgi:hypothetical protein
MNRLQRVVYGEAGAVEPSLPDPLSGRWRSHRLANA